MMIALAFVILGTASLTPVVAVSGTVLVLAILLFTVNILSNLRAS
jgi:hypothetical protein